MKLSQTGRFELVTSFANQSTGLKCFNTTGGKCCSRKSLNVPSKVFTKDWKEVTR